MSKENIKIIIGVTGTHASGKDTVADYICGKYNLKNYSTSDEVRYEATKRGLDHSRANLHDIANEIREKFGTGEWAKRALERMNENMAAVTAIRNIGEIEYLKKNSDFYLIAVDAPIEIRYERARGRDRIGDGKTLEEFRLGEERELNAGIAGQQLVPCMRMADYFILNDGTLEDLNNRTEEIMKAIISQSKTKSAANTTRLL